MTALVTQHTQVHRAHLSVHLTPFDPPYQALLAHNLLEKTHDIDGNNVYRSTERGMKFIECCEEIRGLIGLVMNNRRIDPMSDFYAFDGR